MKIGDAVAATGVTSVNGFEPVVVTLTDGEYRNRLLSQCADMELVDETFLTSALFSPVSISEFKGRSKENAKVLKWFPMDFDLADFVGIDRERIRLWPQSQILDTVDALIKEVKEIYDAIGLPYHRIDYTGYGCAFYTYLPTHDDEQGQLLMALHGRLVDRINTVAGEPLADPAVRDAGSRFTRLPPSPNRKGPVERFAETLEFTPFDEAPVTFDQLMAIGGAVHDARPTTPVASHELAQEDMATLVESIAPYWSEGRRHLVAIGLCGLMAKSGVSEDQAREVIAALSVDDDETRDRFSCVRTTYRRYRAGGDLKGFYGLKGLISDASLMELDRALRQVREATRPVLVIGEKASVATVTVDAQTYEFAYDPIPEECLVGWVGQYVQNMLPTTEAPSGFHWASAMGWAAASMGRHVCHEYQGPLFANLYLLLVGPSGKSRKDTAIGNVRNILLQDVHDGYTYTSPEPQVHGDIQSAEGVIDVLHNLQEAGKPANAFFYLSEFSKMMGNAMRAGTSTISPVLMELFDCPPFIGTTGRGKPVRVQYPYVNIMAATQPAILAGLVRPDDMSSGFANRWFFVLGNGSGPKPRPAPVDQAWLNAAHRRLLETINSYKRNDGAPYLLPLAAECDDVWDEWYIEQHNKRDRSEEESDMRRRHATFARKLALIYAVLDGGTDVQLRHLLPGMAAVEWMWGHLQPMVATWGRSTDGLIEERVIAVLSSHGAMKRRDLQAYCRNRRWNTADVNRVVGALMTADQIVQGQESMLALAGR
jgi:hypothetical protein